MIFQIGLIIFLLQNTSLLTLNTTVNCVPTLEIVQKSHQIVIHFARLAKVRILWDRFRFQLHLGYKSQKQKNNKNH